MTTLLAPQAPHLFPHDASELEEDGEAPKTIKEILAMLDGVFPMDKAVIDGEDSFSATNLSGNPAH
jgi:hypothetical protein